MSIGKIRITQTPNGRPHTIELNGQKLHNVRGYTIENTVSKIPRVTLTFNATAEVIEGYRHEIALDSRFDGTGSAQCTYCGRCASFTPGHSDDAVDWVNLEPCQPPRDDLAQRRANTRAHGND